MIGPGKTPATPPVRVASGLVLAVFGILALMACGPRGEQADALDVTIVSISPDPAVVGDAEITLHVRDAAGDPVSDATILVEGTMTHAGMEPVIVATEARGNGTYVSEGFRFTMGGDWVIIVRATFANGRTAERHIDLKGVQGEMKMDMKSDEDKEGN